MTILAVIPARLAAVRLPRKPLRHLGGVPLAVRVWERVTAMEIADRVVVATESPDVAEVVAAAGAECVLTRADHSSGTHRVAEVVARPPFRGHDVIVNVQGDEPFLSRAAVRAAVDQIVGRGFPLGTAAVVATPAVLREASIVKVVCADDGRALYFSRAPIPFLRDAEDEAVRDALVLQHLGVYAYTPDALAGWAALPPHPLEVCERLEQLRPLAAGMAMGVGVLSDAPLMQGIDTEADLIKANTLWTDGVGAGTGSSAVGQQVSLNAGRRPDGD